jgi:hypothetical protein
VPYVAAGRFPLDVIGCDTDPPSRHFSTPESVARSRRCRWHLARCSHGLPNLKPHTRCSLSRAGLAISRLPLPTEAGGGPAGSRSCLAGVHPAERLEPRRYAVEPTEVVLRALQPSAMSSVSPGPRRACNLVAGSPRQVPCGHFFALTMFGRPGLTTRPRALCLRHSLHRATNGP